MSRHKIIDDFALLQQLLEMRRSEGQQIVLANGVFDLFHVGHVRYLQAARKEGDCLVVAINSDKQAERHKGPGLPLNTEQERAEVLASLAAVDYVTIFDFPVVAPLIRALKPHVHAKGTDYDLSKMPLEEREALAAHGGRHAFVGDPKDHSTTSLIERVRNLPEAPQPATTEE